MIKVTPPTIEQLVKPDHDAYIVGVTHATAQPEIVGSAPTRRKGRAIVERINKISSDDYPRFIAVDRDACYMDPDAPKPVRLPVRYPVTTYAGPYPLVAVILETN